MKRIAVICLGIAMVMSLTACGGNKLTEKEQQGQEYSEHLESGEVSLTEYEKRTLALMEDMPPMTLELSKDETFTIGLPFETEVLNFTTGNDKIAEILANDADGGAYVYNDYDMSADFYLNCITRILIRTLMVRFLYEFIQHS